jgi:hypothetical protein
LDGEPASSERLRRAIRRSIYAGHDHFLDALPLLLVRYPQLSSYVASALTQAPDFIAPNVRLRLKADLAGLLRDKATPEFMAMKLIGVLSHPAYSDRAALENYTRSINPRGLAFRFALDALRATGGIPDDVRAQVARMDGWGARSVLADHTAVAVSTLRVSDPLTAALSVRQTA